jgi:hypothetical protein
LIRYNCKLASPLFFHPFHGLEVVGAEELGGYIAGPAVAFQSLQGIRGYGDVSKSSNWLNLEEHIPRNPQIHTIEKILLKTDVDRDWRIYHRVKSNANFRNPDLLIKSKIEYSITLISRQVNSKTTY